MERLLRACFKERVDNKKIQCYISTRTELLSCSGVVKERYQSENGNILVFRIENGFYVLDRKNK